MLIKILAVLAATFLVAAVGVATVLPPNESLSQLLSDIDGSILVNLQSFELGRLGGWAWQGITVPLLVRPLWYLPLALGMICFGAAATLNWTMTPTRPRSRRS